MSHILTSSGAPHRFWGDLRSAAQHHDRPVAWYCQFLASMPPHIQTQASTYLLEHWHAYETLCFDDPVCLHDLVRLQQWSKRSWSWKPLRQNLWLVRPVEFLYGLYRFYNHKYKCWSALSQRICWEKMTRFTHDFMSWICWEFSFFDENIPVCRSFFALGQDIEIAKTHIQQGFYTKQPCLFHTQGAPGVPWWEHRRWNAHEYYLEALFESCVACLGQKTQPALLGQVATRLEMVWCRGKGGEMPRWLDSAVAGAILTALA